jgi:hypothetical protein
MGLMINPYQLRRTHLERTYNLRQSYTRARFQKPCFFLFKCLSCKLRLFLNGDFILRDKDSKDGYAFRFKKPGKLRGLIKLHVEEFLNILSANASTSTLQRTL